jgi:hypothetical protein
MSAARREAPQRFLVTVVGNDHWNPEVRRWLERPAGTTADQVLAEFRKKYPPPFTVVVMPDRGGSSGMG